MVEPSPYSAIDAFPVPTELLIQILLFLPYRRLVFFRLVCRRFCEVIDNTESLHLHVELGAAGYTWSRSNTLASFRRLQKVYRNPQPKRRDHETINILTLLSPADRERWGRGMGWKYEDYYIKTTAEASPDRTIFLVIWLGAPADRDHSPVQRVHTIETARFVQCVAVDSLQDLLLVKEYGSPAIYFLSLATGGAHCRMSMESDGKLDSDHAPDVTVASLRGDWVLLNERYMKGQEGSGRISLYHWPSGAAGKHWTYAVARSIGWHDAFYRGCLAGDYLIMPFLQDERPNDGLDCAPCINIYRLPSAGDGATEPTLLASYGLPVWVSTATVDVNVPVQYYVPLPSSSYSLPALLFITLLSMEYWVPSSVFIRWDDEEFLTSHPRKVPWEAWGPQSLHPAGHSARNRYPLGVSGLHVIHHNTILDFNRYDVATNVYDPRADGILSVTRRGPVDWTMRGPTPRVVDVELPALHDSRSGLHTRGHWYRQTLHVFDNCSWMKDSVVHVIEEADDVKLAVLSPRLHPTRLEFWYL